MFWASDQQRDLFRWPTSRSSASPGQPGADEGTSSTATMSMAVTMRTRDNSIGGTPGMSLCIIRTVVAGFAGVLDLGSLRVSRQGAVEELRSRDVARHRGRDAGGGRTGGRDARWDGRDQGPGPHRRARQGRRHQGRQQPEEAEEAAEQILGMDIRGHTVRRVLRRGRGGDRHGSSTSRSRWTGPRNSP